MSYDTRRKDYSKEHMWYIEIDIDSTTYRFCQNISPLPAGLEAIPSLESVRVNPAEIDLSGGIGVRGRLNCTLVESMDYTVWGTVQNPVRFWARWRAENPFYFGKPIRAYSGYLVNGVFDPANFQQRYYIIEGFTHNGGTIQITGKDILKLANDDRAKAPRESTGELSFDILSTDTSVTLIPAGVGDAEYPASGFGRLGDEVVSFTRVADVFTIVRGQFNTVADDHSEGDLFQLCLQYTSETVSDIDFDLLTNYADIDPAFIPKAAWDAEVASAFTTTYSTLITEPTGVTELLREFSGDSAPHFLYWDERVNLIQLVALKPPAENAQPYTYDANIIEGSFGVNDRHKMRVSTVIVNFGQFDPTKDLDEPSNYRQTYVREDTDSVTNYGQRAYKVIYSRWISNDNKTAAILASARIGRRFSDTPRECAFAVDPKDADIWAGESMRLESDIIIEQGTGDFAVLPYQVVSVQDQGQRFNYRVLEHTYGPPVDGDNEVEDPNVRLVFINGENDRLLDDLNNPRTLRELYDDIYPGDFQPQYDVRFIIEPAGVTGSSVQSTSGIRTGDFTGLTTPPLLLVQGRAVGYGGNGADVNGTPENGGVAIEMQNDLRIDNVGVIGGGGGGGARDNSVEAGAAGGGGAGFTNGGGGLGTAASNPISITQAENGSVETGGAGGRAQAGPPNPDVAAGGNGGDLGQNGQSTGTQSGGLAGAAINQNGFTITWVNMGDVRGAINA